MIKALTAILTATLLSTASAFAQFVSNGGEIREPDTSQFGQAQAFENSTTTFEGIEFRLQRLIRDPEDPSKYRAIAQIENTGQQEFWILYGAPFPALQDELANSYVIDLYTGLEACLNSSRDTWSWLSEPRSCYGTHAESKSAHLVPGIPVVTSLRFVPASDEAYNPDLASLSSSVTLRLNLVLSPDRFKTNGERTIHRVTIPNIPLPQ
ncbi:MAG: hypothetical protein V2I43_09735 [Parvularcula sp.]|jgi:hypothetical protein|nr:hypothetical protein [Parvularcula sp.]